MIKFLPWADMHKKNPSRSHVTCAVTTMKRNGMLRKTRDDAVWYPRVTGKLCILIFSVVTVWEGQSNTMR